MRIVRVEIERFMGLRRVSLALNPHLQLIAGPNNSGKTTLFRALEFFFAPELFEAARVQPQNDYFREEGPRALTRVRLYFGSLTQTERTTFSDAVTQRSGRFWVEVRLSRRGQLTYRASRDQPGDELHKLLLEHLDIVHVPAVRVDRDRTLRPETERLAATLKDVLVRSRPGRDTEVQKRFASLARSVSTLLTRVLDASKNHMSELALPGVDIEFSTPAPPELLASALSRLRVKRAGTDIELSDEGTGIQSLLSFGILRHTASRERSRAHIFLVEEPEAFLHPQLQRALAAQLKALSRDVQVLATTHSPIIIDAVDIREVCRLRRDPDGLQYSWDPEELTDKESAQLRRFCDVKNSELVFAQKVICCEGPSDHGALIALCESELAEADVAVVAMGSADVAEHFAKLGRRFQLDTLFVLDKDKVASDRTTLRKLAAAVGTPFTDAETDRLNRLGQRQCRTRQEAARWRSDANALVSSRGVYCIGNDIEGAVSFSYRKDKILDALGPNHAGHLSTQQVTDLRSRRGKSYLSRLRELVGSKGWNIELVAQDAKLKQHVPKLVITLLGRPHPRSELGALREAIRKFVEERASD